MSEVETTTGNEVEQAKSMNIKELCDVASKMEVSEKELVSNYYDFGVGDTLKILPLGVKRIDKMTPTKEDWDNKSEDEDKPKVSAIRFLNTEDGQFYITAAAVIVSTLEEAARENEREGTTKKFYNVDCIGEKVSPKGKYLTFSIKPLV